MAADLRRGEHIPKMQNNIGRKSMLCVLRQLRRKDGGGLGAVLCRHAVPGHAARRAVWRYVLHNCREFTPDRIRQIRQRQRQKHRVGSNHLPTVLYSNTLPTAPRLPDDNLFLTQIFIYCTEYYTILYYTILYYTILYYTILYYTILYYTKLN